MPQKCKSISPQCIDKAVPVCYNSTRKQNWRNSAVSMHDDAVSFSSPLHEIIEHASELPLMCQHCLITMARGMEFSKCHSSNENHVLIEQDSVI